MDIGKLMAQAQKMQADMEKVQGELAKERVEASSGGGMVTVVATGAGEIVSIKIDPEAVDTDDIELLEDMVLGAIKEAMRSATDLQNSRMQNVMPAGMGGMGGMGLPGF